MSVGFAPAQQVKRKAARGQRAAFYLVLPLLVFMSIGFFLPVAMIFFYSVDNPEVSDAFPSLQQTMAGWKEGSGVPGEAAYVTIATEIVPAMSDGRLQKAAKRVNYELDGGRTLLMKTARALSAQPLAPGENATQRLQTIDKQWSNPKAWSVLYRNSGPVTDYYFLKALDMGRGTDGSISRDRSGEALYVDVFLRTFTVSLVVTLSCLLAGYPVAYLLAKIQAKYAGLLMMLVLLPFWTSVLVRTAGWIVILQKNGVVNNLLSSIGLINDPLELVYNRFGVYVAMTHILLPFMILPLYATMKSIPHSYMRAALSLGSSWPRAFWKIYLPLTLPGVSAGCVLVFVSAIGYYVTPVLVGGGGDQLISYFVAYFVNEALNWGQAAALGVLLLLCVLIIYGVFGRLFNVRATMGGSR